MVVVAAEWVVCALAEWEAELSRPTACVVRVEAAVDRKPADVEIVLSVCSVLSEEAGVCA